MFAVSSLHSAEVIEVTSKNTAVIKSAHLKEVTSVTLPNGKKRIKFQQFYRGVPVFNFTLTAAELRSGHNLWQGSLLTHIDKDIESVNALLSEDDAIDVLLKACDVKEGVEVKYQEVIKYIYNEDTGKAKLVYEVSFFLEGDDPSRPTAIIDANTGKIIDKWEGLNTKKGTGPGGNQKTGKYFYGTDFLSFDVTEDCQMSSDTVDTVNMNHLKKGGEVFTITPCTETPDNTYQEINGAFSPLNDAHVFGNVIFNLFKDWYNIAPLTFKLIMRVHYGVNYGNAFWNGREMTFGDGGILFYPLVSLDISAHEVTHGFTGQHSNLIYRNQSGGMNESFSDISGEAAEYYYYQGTEKTNDWLVGAEIYTPHNAALRYFENPERDGRSIGEASKYRNGMDVHFSSGVFNRAFYLLANTEHWDVRQAYDVFVLANQIYWKRDETFETGACGLKRATQDLEYNTADLIKAFNTVGVDATCGEVPPEPPPPPTEIKSNERIKNLSGDKGSKFYYYVNVPPHSKMLQVQTSVGTGDVDLYTRAYKIPEVEKFDCRSTSDSNREVCYLHNPKPGIHYILLYGYAAYSGTQLYSLIY